MLSDAEPRIRKSDSAVADPVCIPVVEQAKGIIMAEYHCGPEEAFELLRQASQSRNVKVRVLAKQLVERYSNLTSGLPEP